MPVLLSGTGISKMSPCLRASVVTFVTAFVPVGKFRANVRIVHEIDWSVLAARCSPSPALRRSRRRRRRRRRRGRMTDAAARSMSNRRASISRSRSTATSTKRCGRRRRCSRGFSRYAPVDGAPADHATDVLVWYSPTAMHFGIRASAPAGTVRATLADRDRIQSDDHVIIFLSTYQRRPPGAGVRREPARRPARWRFAEGTRGRAAASPA